ncbi:hypothetical protein BVX98_03725, partial [bacterium F11]
MTILRKWYEKETSYNPRERKALFHQLKKAVRLNSLVSFFFQNNLPHALRERALLAALEGKGRKSKRLFEKALKVATNQHAHYEWAQTLLAQSQVGKEWGWPDSAEKEREAKKILRQIEYENKETAETTKAKPEKSVTLSLIDRFDNIMEQGRTIASALSKEDIFRSIGKAAMTLIRGEECHIFEVEEKGGERLLHPVQGDFLNEEAHLLLDHASIFGGSIVFDAKDSEPLTYQYLGHKYRSILCGPITVRGRLSGFFVLVHKKISGLFGQEEIRLANYIATIAGAALENAQGFSQLQNINQYLEDRVEERTKELSEANTKLEFLTFTDPLTKLLN